MQLVVGFDINHIPRLSLIEQRQQWTNGESMSEMKTYHTLVSSVIITVVNISTSAQLPKHLSLFSKSNCDSRVRESHGVDGERWDLDNLVRILRAFDCDRFDILMESA